MTDPNIDFKECPGADIRINRSLFIKHVYIIYTSPDQQFQKHSGPDAAVTHRLLLETTISGIVAIAAPPSVNLAAGTPFVYSIIPLFRVDNDVAVGVNTRNTFVEACFNNASNIAIQTIWTWLGSSVLQLPAISVLVRQRTQDPAKLFEAGARGIPYLSISGTADKIVLNDNITEEIRPHFTNLEVYKIEGGSHALFIDNKDEFIQVLIPYAKKVLKRT
ncbi:hypothetical protein BDQ17DRAFT_920306 [Cyathus striatus]|nr:hypothetical protein BDQ17DRAFT_920306 [Cyathus striatus]